MPGKSADMPAALSISAVLIGFVAASGFLFGQLFFGHFSFPASLAGVAGLACSFGAFNMAGRPAWAPAWVAWAGIAALAGVAMDAAHYYLYLAIPGNYYAWALIGPFAACTAFVAFVARRRRSHRAGS